MHQLFARIVAASLLTSCAPEVSDPHPAATTGAPVFATSIDVPPVLRGLPVEASRAEGGTAVIPCTTCHGPDRQQPLPTGTSGLAGPHTGLKLRHGTLRCASCHHPLQRERLRLADGSSLALTDAMALCAQCHGSKKQDYDHGAHGGMRGHWDLSRGPRERNHCVSCHDPHAPAFGTFMPVSGPKDRFTLSDEDNHHE